MKALFTIGLLGALLAASACAPEHNARNSLDWAGSYYGEINCKGEPKDTRLTLNEDGTYHLWTRKKSDLTQTNRVDGHFHWNWDGNHITLDESAKFGDYIVGEGTVTVLDEHGNKRDNAPVLYKK